MRIPGVFVTSLVVCFIASSSFAQLPPVKTDTLHPAQGAPGAAGCSTTEASSCAQAAAKITPIVMGESPLEENLRRLTDGIGGRVTGSPEMAKAVEWGVAGFRAAGVDVHTEKYTLPVTWSERETRLEVLGPEAFPVSLVSLGLSPATPAGGLEGVLVDIGPGTEADFSAAGAAAKGAILVVRTEVSYTWNDLFNEYRYPPGIIDRAVKAGALAILWVGERERKLLYRHTNSTDGRLERIPQAVAAREDGLRLERVARANRGNVRVRLTMPNKIGGPVEQQNVVGEIHGYEKPDEIVVLGAHLDSWELGTGALDNGCNAALVVEAARAIEKSHLQPRRTLRFILFTGEEQGMVGSHAYVLQHRAELDNIRAVIVYDGGTGRVTGYSLGGRDDIKKGVTEVLAPLAAWGVNQHTLDASAGTDNFDFLLEGVPTLVANQEESNYMTNYHASTDTLDKVDFRNLQLHVAIAALTAYGIADRPDPLGPRQSRQEIDALLKRTGLDRDLKALGYWPAWESGAR